RSSCDLSGMRREYRHGANRAQRCKRLLETDSCVLEAAKGSRDRSCLRGAAIHLRGPTAAFAVIRLGEVDQLEVNGKRAHDEKRMLEIHRSKRWIVGDSSFLALLNAQISQPLDRG